MKSKFLKTVFVFSISVSSAAFATIPTPISGTPPQGTSPGTSQTTPGTLPNPGGYPGNAAHPDPSIGNYPPLAWFQNSFYPEIVGLENAASELYQWAQNYDSWANVSYYSSWLWNVSDYIRVYTYSDGFNPIYYSSWNYYVTRGDILYWNYWWVRPLYFQLLREGATYHANTLAGDPGRQEYLQSMIKLRNAYHRFIRCIHGRNGSDSQAADDTEALSFEHQAGI